MTLLQSALWSTAICLLAAILEGLLAGRGVKAHLRSLRMPSWSPSLAGWLVVGALYYLLCFSVLFRLLSGGGGPLRMAALALLGVLLICNALWNGIFFRLRNLHLSFQFLLPYAFVALVLWVLLLRLDPATAWLFVAYLTYLVFAAAWVHSIWRLNRTRS